MCRAARAKLNAGAHWHSAAVSSTATALACPVHPSLMQLPSFFPFSSPPPPPMQSTAKRVGLVQVMPKGMGSNGGSA
jgi:hypothetical protein